MFDTDDLFTHNARHVETSYIGCGGEFCGGPYGPDNPRGPEDTEPECAACRNRTRNTGLTLMSNDRADEYEMIDRGQS